MAAPTLNAIINFSTGPAFAQAMILDQGLLDTNVLADAPDHQHCECEFGFLTTRQRGRLLKNFCARQSKHAEHAAQVCFGKSEAHRCMPAHVIYE